ncbi:MAG TPA: succinate dehydrogenase, hydrophobic membrane anchor protein [Steroidobacteraceae bacterium]|nr:succinate dehydrogenase, hydrophobic membrane anchor protein [Steroidobacteraceae bacterium]
MSLRSPLGRVLGMGSAKDGTGHWWAERVSSVALVPLTLWAVGALLALPRLDFLAVRTFFAEPLHSLLAVLLVAVMAYHSDLGTAVIVEDYVHVRGVKVFLLLLLRFAYVLIAGSAIFALLQIAFGRSPA